MADADLKIKVIADTAAAHSGLKGLESQAGATGAGMGGMAKAGLAAGAALVAVGVKSVMAFEDLGLSVGKFSDATGVSHEEASRLIEVAGDIGISTESLQSGIGKMEKALGANAKAFSAYGVEVVKANDGTIDANATFLAATDAINKIDDPLKKAEAGAKIFGKGWQGMSELIGQGSTKLKADLAAVDDAKIFDDKKVKQARDLRDGFDAIKDAGENLMLTIGSALAPVIAKLAPELGKIIDAAKPLAEAIGNALAGAMEALGPIIDALLPLVTALAKGLGLITEAIFGDGTHALQEFSDKLGDLSDRALAAGISHEKFQQTVNETGMTVEKLTKIVETAEKTEIAITEGHREHDIVLKQLSDTVEHHGVVAADAKDKVFELSQAENAAAEEAGRAQRNTDNLTASWEALKGALSDQQAWIDVENAFADVQTKGTEAFDAAKKGADDAAQKSRDYQSSLIDLKNKVIDYAKEVGGLPPQQVTWILAEIDQGSIATANQALDAIAQARQVIYNAQVADHREFTTTPTTPKKATGAGASGAIVTRPTNALIGEGSSPAEAVIPLDQMPGASPLPDNLFGGGGVTNHITIQTGADPRQVISIIKQYQRNGGVL